MIEAVIDQFVTLRVGGGESGVCVWGGGGSGALVAWE